MQSISMTGRAFVRLDQALYARIQGGRMRV